MNIGIVLIGHGRLASETKKILEFINQEKSEFFCIDVIDSNQTEQVKRELVSTISRANQGHGVLILSDLYGATPHNLCISQLKKGEIELISGYNLPMLLKLSQMKENPGLEELIRFLTEYGKRNIFYKGPL